MNLKEIVNRDIQKSFDLKEMEFVIVEYIHAKKGKRPPLDTQANLSMYPRQIQAFMLQQQVPLAQYCFDVACKYFRN